MGRAESHVQNYVLDRLALLERKGLCYAFRNNSFTGRVMRYNGSEGYIKNSKRGMPDVVACFIDLAYDRNEILDEYLLKKRGQFVGIEVKSATGRQSLEQKLAQENIEKVGGLYWLIRTPEELESRLKEIGIV